MALTFESVDEILLCLYYSNNNTFLDLTETSLVVLSLFWNWLFGKILCHAKPLSSVSQFWLTLNAFLNWFRPVKRSNNAPGTFRQSFRRHCSQSCAYSDETTWYPRWWRIPLENPWKCHFRDSKFHNVARCHGPQELVPWCEFQSRLLFIIICLLLKTFWQPCCHVHTVHVGFRCLYLCLLNSKKYSLLMSVDEIVFNFFFQV